MNVQREEIFVNSSNDDNCAIAEAAPRFWAKVRKGDGCWEWTGAQQRRGYGHLSVGGKDTQAHRLSWHLHNGAIPDGMCVCHRCDNPRCVRPDHLFLGSHLDNMRDRAAKGRTATGANRLYPTGTAHHNAILSDEQVRAILAEHVPGKVGYARLAQRYGVSKTLVHFIITGRRREAVAA